MNKPAASRRRARAGLAEERDAGRAAYLGAAAGAEEVGARAAAGQEW
jgi:hypothetical protein